MGTVEHPARSHRRARGISAERDHDLWIGAMVFLLVGERADERTGV
jgi:hypothetical protein